MAGSQWTGWLNELRAAGKGPVTLRAIDRGLPYTYILGFGADYSGDAFAASLRASPDAGGAPIETFTMTVDVFADGITPVSFSLTPSETAALPADGDFDGLSELVFDLLHTPAGGTQYRILGGNVQVSGEVTSYGS